MRTSSFIAALFLFLAVSNFILWKEIAQGASLRLVFFDVGQGDAIFLETPQGHQILIDGGPDEKILEKLAREMLPWDRDIDLVILTHPEKDHVQGLLSVLKDYEVKNILWTGVEKDTKIFSRWQESLGEESEQGAQVFLATPQERIVWHKESRNAFIAILHPSSDTIEELEESEVNTNDTSMVGKLVFKNSSVLFTGDIGRKAELALLSLDIQAGILKVAHHGSKYSSSPVFLERVSPEVAVISAGKENRYQHPHEETLARLQQYGIEIRRTDKEGNITFLLR